MSEGPAAAETRGGPPRLRGAEQAAFLLGAFVVVVVQVLLLWRLQHPSAPPPPPTPPAGNPLAGGAVDGAGILWINVEDVSFRPPHSEVTAGEEFELRLRNKSRKRRTLKLRPQAGGVDVATWVDVLPAFEAGKRLTLPRGMFILEIVGEPQYFTIIEAK